MIETWLGEKHRSVKTLKKGTIFRTNRNGKLIWSPWFKTVENPKYRVYLHPTKRKRWGIKSIYF